MSLAGLRYGERPKMMFLWGNSWGPTAQARIAGRSSRAVYLGYLSATLAGR